MNARRRRIALTLACGALATLGAAAAVLVRRPPPAYGAGEAVPGITSSLSREAPDEAPRIVLTDVTAEAGIAMTHLPGGRSSQLPEDMGPGAAWGDVDGDGDDDLVLPNFSRPLDGAAPSGATHALFLNRGDGTFEDATAGSGLDVEGTALAAAFADVDGDGDLDLALSQYGRCVLLRNDGTGRFEDVSQESGIAGPEGFWTGLSWADFDADSDLDLHVCGYVRYEPPPSSVKPVAPPRGVLPFTLNPSSHPPERNLLFRNDGTGRFEEVAVQAGVDNPKGRSLSAAWADFDEDGRLDLYVANDVSDNAMFRNRGDGTFEEVSHAAWVADYRGAMGLAVGDHDGDLDLDLFVTHWVAQENALYRSLLRDGKPLPDGVTMRFVDDADRVGLGQVSLPRVGWGTELVDFDHDGRLDLLVVNGSTFEVDDAAPRRRLEPEPGFLFWNAGPGRGFHEMTPPALAVPRVARGAALADYDRDGDVDVLVTVQGGSPVLLRNDSAEASWIRVRLEGVASPRTGVGSRIEVEADGRRQVRVAGGSPSYLSQSSALVHFGLGHAERVDVLEVRWTSGGVDVVRDVAARQEVVVREGSGEAAATAPARAGLAGDELGRQREFWTRYRAAQASWQEGRLEDAIAGYREALALQPDHEDALYGLGNLLLEAGRPVEAGQAWETLCRVNDLSARAHHQLGALYSLPGPTLDLAAAEAQFRRAVEINREESGALVRLGEVLVARGRLDEAREWLTAGARLNPKASAAHYLLAYVAWEQDRPDEAVAALGRALASLEDDRAPVKGATSEGDTQERLRRLHREALRRSLFGPLWTDLRDRHDPGALDASDAAAEAARVSELLATLRAPAAE